MPAASEMCLVVISQDTFRKTVFFFKLSLCLCLTIHICHSTPLVVFSLYTRRDIDSDDSHAHSSMCAHSPLSGSSVKEFCAQDTEQIHGKHGSGALFESRCSLSTLVVCPLVIATVGCEAGTSAELVGTSVELVAGYRWNEYGTRCCW